MSRVNLKYLFLQAKEDFEIWCKCLQKYSLEDRNQSARSTCRTKLICLGHTDSYAGVSQSTLTCLHLTTSGQEKYDFLTHSNNIQVETLKLRKDGLFVYKGRAKQEFLIWAQLPSKVLTRRLQIKVQDHPAELNNSCLGPSDSYTGALQSTLTCQVNF